jgi:hypothetical protein
MPTWMTMITLQQVANYVANYGRKSPQLPEMSPASARDH